MALSLCFDDNLLTLSKDLAVVDWSFDGFVHPEDVWFGKPGMYYRILAKIYTWMKQDWIFLPFVPYAFFLSVYFLINHSIKMGFLFPTFLAIYISFSQTSRVRTGEQGKVRRDNQQATCWQCYPCFHGHDNLWSLATVSMVAPWIEVGPKLNIGRAWV